MIVRFLPGEVASPTATVLDNRTIGCRALRTRCPLGEHLDRGEDARAPVTDQLPRPRNSDEQRTDQCGAEYVQRGFLTGIGDKDNPGNKFRPEDQQQQVKQPELTAPLRRRRRTGKDRSRPGGYEQDAGDPEHDSWPPDADPRLKPEERDREGVNEGQQGSTGPDLPDDGRTPIGAIPRRHRHGDEEQTRQCCRSAGQRSEELTGSSGDHHFPHGTRVWVQHRGKPCRRPGTRRSGSTGHKTLSASGERLRRIVTRANVA
jgi:hypothetical protein